MPQVERLQDALHLGAQVTGAGAVDAERGVHGANGRAGEQAAGAVAQVWRQLRDELLAQLLHVAVDGWVLGDGVGGGRAYTAAGVVELLAVGGVTTEALTDFEN